jgi:transcription elongation factor GreA-like protein
MITLFVHVLWASVAVYALHTVLQAVALFAPTIENEDFPNELVEVPDDLLAVASQERESWAQEEVVRAMRERYEELKDWNKVRGAFGVGRID